MPKIFPLYQQHRHTTGMHTRRNCIKIGGQKNQDEQILLLSREPGLNNSNYKKRRDAHALLNVIALLNIVQSNNAIITTFAPRNGASSNNANVFKLLNDQPILYDYNNSYELQRKIIREVKSNLTSRPHKALTYQTFPYQALNTKGHEQDEVYFTRVKLPEGKTPTTSGIDNKLSAAMRVVGQLVSSIDFNALLSDPLRFPAAEAVVEVSDRGLCPNKIEFIEEDTIKRKYSFARGGRFSAIKLSNADLSFCEWIKHDPDSVKTNEFLKQELINKFFSAEQLTDINDGMSMVKACDDIDFANLQKTLKITLSEDEKKAHIKQNAKHFHNYCMVLNAKISQYQEDIFCLLKIPPYY